MSAATKKPLPGTPGRRTSTDPPGASPSRTPTTPTNGMARSRSLRNGTPVSARASLRPGAGASNLSHTSSTSEADDEARADNVAKLDDFKERLLKAETSAEQAQKQSQILQARLDESVEEQGRLEDRVHEYEERLEQLEN